MSEEKRMAMEFDGRIVAADMDLQTALILAEAFAEKFCEDMERGARIILYYDNAKLHVNESDEYVNWEA